MQFALVLLASLNLEAYTQARIRPKLRQGKNCIYAGIVSLIDPLKEEIAVLTFLKKRLCLVDSTITYASRRIIAVLYRCYTKLPKTSETRATDGSEARRLAGTRGQPSWSEFLTSAEVATGLVRCLDSALALQLVELRLPGCLGCGRVDDPVELVESLA